MEKINIVSNPKTKKKKQFRQKYRKIVMTRQIKQNQKNLPLLEKELLVTPQNLMGTLPNMKKLKVSSSVAKRAKKMLTENYMTSLLVPEFAENAKIPSYLPLPTVSAHTKVTVQTSTGSSGVGSGSLAILVNPCVGVDSGNTITGILINNDITNNLTTGGGGGAWQAISQNSKITVGTASTWRLVSASITIYVEANVNSASGHIAGGIFTAQQNPASWTPGATGISPGGNYNIASSIDQAMYYQKAQIAGQAGVRAIYLPFDPSFEVFLGMNNSRNVMSTQIDNFLWNFYIFGCGAGQNVTIDIVYNYELEPLPNTILQIVATPRIEPNQTDGVLAAQITAHPALVAQSGDIMKIPTLIHESLVEPQRNRMGWLDDTLTFISKNAGTLTSIVRGIGGLL